MDIWVNKDYLDDLYKCAVEKNSYLLFAGIEFYVTETEAKDFLKEKLDEIIFRIKRAYNPELVKLKQQAREYYQSWCRFKDSDKKTAREMYAGYLDAKRKIVLLQDGDDGQ